MPVYLCQPGAGQKDAWRHGIQVFSSPCAIDDETAVPLSSATATATLAATTTTNNNGTIGGERDLVVGSWTFAEQEEHVHHLQQQQPTAAGRGTRTAAATTTTTTTSTTTSTANHHHQMIRRVRHAELVLVDDVCIAYGRYWLRLRWPGQKGGFAGYIAMNKLSEGNLKELPVHSNDDHIASEDENLDDPAREETGSMPPSEPGESDFTTLTCARTGLTFQTSHAMKLLAVYDDGLSPPVALAPLPTESVFCRICREGLHDDADDEQPAAEADGDDALSPKPSRQNSSQATMDSGDDLSGDELVRTAFKGPVTPHPTYSTNADAVRNPMLAPCECSGSMAFVHYLCVEQWRCRSRHPEAHNGLNCETCGSPYALPPPSGREVFPQFDQDQDDWLEAMPPHVMQALRQPHIWWQLGAAIVRRRWLRPIAPILMSPIVALYCRARRLLKKRGVARRRWACSLCRRRARWKCVRCLRSYYCSRQCQNVSWHIIHKHVCYKPVRFWWSVIVYGAFVLMAFPGILRDPLMYDVGLFSVPVSFFIMAVLGGSGATLIKKMTGMDLRGRLLEFTVVVATMMLTYLSWGLIRGFFGDVSACHGALGTYEITAEDLSAGVSLVKLFQTLVLKPAKTLYLSLDKIFLLYTGPWVRSALCHGPIGCFEHLPLADENFFLQENRGERCAADMVTLLSLYVFAFVSFLGSYFAKHQERRQRRERLERRQIRRPFQREVHLHQD